MPAGLLVLNDGYKVQLSSNTKNPVLTASGVAAPQANDLTNGPSTAKAVISYAPNGSARPLIAIRPSGNAMIYSQVLAGGVWTWTFIVGGGGSVPYWIFDQAPAFAADGLFAVYDAAGELAYSAQRKPLRVTPPFITADLPNPTIPESSSQDWTFTAGRTYAAMFGKPSGYRRWGNAGGGNWRLRSAGGTVSALADGIRTSQLTYSQAGLTTDPDFGQETASLSRLIIPVDVTNY